VLSRIAEALYETGRDIECAQNVVRVLEVQHKMELARPTRSPEAAWLPLFHAFGVDPGDEPDEEALYGALVLGREHPFSARGRIALARQRARTLRDHLSEEMWEHLNRVHLELAPLRFADIRRIGRSEFNRRIELFCDAFHGLADDTMVHGPEWHFLRLGRFLERAAMLCRVLDVKRRTLELVPEDEGRPIDFHQWQGLLRSVSGYEPYRRIYDARIVPSRVLELVLWHPEFPRSYAYCLARVEESLRAVTGEGGVQRDLLRDVQEMLRELGPARGPELARRGVEAHIHRLAQCWSLVDEGMRVAYFRTLRPAARIGVGASRPRLAEQSQQ